MSIQASFIHSFIHCKSRFFKDSQGQVKLIWGSCQVFFKINSRTFNANLILHSITFNYFLCLVQGYLKLIQGYLRSSQGHSRTSESESENENMNLNENLYSQSEKKYGSYLITLLDEYFHLTACDYYLNNVNFVENFILLKNWRHWSEILWKSL